ncbi:MAG: hypothetical protein RL637_1477 [Pseudomonadota bacterium]|jgi:hypothetical protein
MNIDPIWENSLLAIFAILILIWMLPSLKMSHLKSQAAKSDWSALILPLIFVLMVVMILIILV